MSSQIRLKRGLKANLPKLVQGEPAYTTDTQEVFIGNGTTNVQLAKKSDLDGYIRNDQNSTINGSLTINDTGKIIDLKSNGYTDSGFPYNSEYVFETIPTTSAFGSYCEHGGIELKQLGTINDGSGDTLPGLLKLSTDININGNLSINNNNLVNNLNADMLDGAHASDLVNKWGWSTTGVNSTVNQYTKIASITITGQYVDNNVTLALRNGGNGGTVDGSGFLTFRVKQQNALGGVPFVDLKLFGNSSLLSVNNFYAVTTINSAVNTTVELYYKETVTYDVLTFTPIIQNGVNLSYYKNQPYLASLPSGTVTNCTQMAWNGDLSVTGNAAVAGYITTSTQASTDNSTKVATTAFVKSVTGDISTLKTDTKDNIVAAINEIEDDLSNASIVTPSVIFGMNNKITNIGEVTNSPTFTIKGKTVINLLGKDGNCEDTSKWGAYLSTMSLDGTNKVFGVNAIKITMTSTAGNISNIITKYNMDATKYYFVSAYIKNGNATNIAIGKDTTGGGVGVFSPVITDNTKFTRVGFMLQPSDIKTTNYIVVYVNGAVGTYAYIDGIMVNEITSSEYALGVNTLLANYHYVDSYACLQNPYIEVKHNNLVRNGNGEEGTSWWNNINEGNADSASTLSIINGKLALTQTNSASHWYTQKVKVKPNTNYYLKSTLSDSTNSYINVTDPLNSVSLFTNNNGTFNTNSYDEICINIQTKGSSPAGTYYFSFIILIEGTTAPSSNRPCVIEKTVLETKLTSDDTIVYKNGEVTGKIWWKHKTLFGKDYDWQYAGDYTGFKIIKAQMQNVPCQDLTPYSWTLPVKYDGSINKSANWNTLIAGANVNYTDGNGLSYMSVADSDSGWTETINPNNDEVKAFMNGWKAIYNDSTRYCGWVSVIDGSVPSGSANSSITATSSGTTVTVADGTKFVASDNLDIVSSTGTVKANIQISSISGNVLTLNRSVSVVTGDVVMKLNSEMVTWCKNNIAPGYEGYQLHYKLQNPESINDNNCIIHGDIPLFDVGDNYLYLDSGIVLGEVANPMLGGGNNNYYLNDTLFNSPLKYKVESLNTAYKNLIFDSKYNRSGYDTGRGYGREFIAWPTAAFDSSATYTVDYKILATQAPQIGTISCSYSQDINSAISNIHESLNSKQAHDSILDQIVDLSVYEKTGVPYDTALPWFTTQNNGYLFVSIIIPISPKKCIPVISLDSLRIVNTPSGSEIDITNKFINTYIIVKPNYVYLRWFTNDATTIANIKSYGVYMSKLNITADCRGRI